MTPNLHAILMALSLPRLSTYLDAQDIRPPSLTQALELYLWNSQVSSALMTPISLCEVVIRNAVDDALRALHGPSWPWEVGFYLSLPLKGRDTLEKARRGQPTTGKVIAELSFGFWENMFVRAFDDALWNPYLATVLPHLPPSMTVQQARGHLRHELDKLRRLRNRIAHHEPLLTLDVEQVIKDIEALIGYRCTDTAAWMVQTNNLAALVMSRPR